MNDQPNQRPARVLRDGMLKATIWKNQGEKGPFFTATLSKTFEQNGDLKDGNSFAGADLLKISELAREAYTEIRDQRAMLSDRHSGEQPAEVAP